MISDSQKIEIAKIFVEQQPTTYAVWTPDEDYQSDDDRCLSGHAPEADKRIG